MHITLKPGIAMLRRLALAVALAAGSSMASAAVIHVTVDGSSFGAATGYLDLGLTTTTNAPLATALVSNMVGFDPAAYTESWGLTPASGGYLFRSDTPNDLFHAVNFGGLLSFDLTFGGVIDPLGSHVSSFYVSAYDEAFDLLGHYDPRHGDIAAFTWTLPRTAGVDGNIVAMIADPAVSFVPEPADALLLGAGLAVMALALRRRVKPAAAQQGASLALGPAA
jgi:hypothetical protein